MFKASRASNISAWRFGGNDRVEYTDVAIDTVPPNKRVETDDVQLRCAQTVRDRLNLVAEGRDRTAIRPLLHLLEHLLGRVQL